MPTLNAPHAAGRTAPLTALTLWRAELRAGRRTAAMIDPLYRAACLERAAEDADREARALHARAAGAETEGDRVRLANCARIAERDAAALRERADAAVVAGFGARRSA